MKETITFSLVSKKPYLRMLEINSKPEVIKMSS